MAPWGAPQGVSAGAGKGVPAEWVLIVRENDDVSARAVAGCSPRATAAPLLLRRCRASATSYHHFRNLFAISCLPCCIGAPRTLHGLGNAHVPRFGSATTTGSGAVPACGSIARRRLRRCAPQTRRTGWGRRMALGERDAEREWERIRDRDGGGTELMFAGDEREQARGVLAAGPTVAPDAHGFTSHNLYENLNKPYVYHVQLDVLHHIQPKKLGDWKDKMSEAPTQFPRAQAGLATQNIELDLWPHPTGNQASWAQERNKTRILPILNEGQYSGANSSTQRLKVIIQCSNSLSLKKSKYSWSTSTKCPARQGGVTELVLSLPKVPHTRGDPGPDGYHAQPAISGDRGAKHPSLLGSFNQMCAVLGSPAQFGKVNELLTLLHSMGWRREKKTLGLHCGQFGNNLAMGPGVRPKLCEVEHISPFKPTLKYPLVQNQRFTDLDSGRLRAFRKPEGESG
ncbi:hypothetical protein DFH07DRAFT_785548 [Mycena maculata]|uniref:Uncharacterized protein n=1 Tax=Mycena maculata TaxID=230809 RepID=A0AAD7HAE6_9AGAR|nr:hypothetical protein DFH07DRAFT_785548 [Mycena maculata]